MQDLDDNFYEHVCIYLTQLLFPPHTFYTNTMLSLKYICICAGIEDCMAYIGISLVLLIYIAINFYALIGLLKRFRVDRFATTSLRGDHLDWGGGNMSRLLIHTYIQYIVMQNS